MRTTLAFFLCFSLFLTAACSDDATTDGGSDSLGDGALGTDDATMSDGDALGSGCLCQLGFTCLPGAGGGYTCVPNADASSDSTPLTDVKGSDVMASSMTCTQVGQCVEDQCTASPQPCGLTCATGASPDVAAKLNGLATCAANKCQNGLCKGQMSTQCMNDCTGSQCGSLLLNCFEDNTPGGNVCNSALACFDTCDKTATSGHFTCMSKCYSGLTTLAKTQLKAFTDCLAKGPGGDASLKACQAEYNACVTGGVTGNGTCVDISKCAANCPPSASACGGDCLALGSAFAQTQVNDMNSCFANNISNQTQCFGQLETCAAPSGTGKCTGVQACTDACKQGFATGDDKGSCTIGCLHNTTKVGADAFLALFTCVIPNCPGCVKGDATCNACLTSKCQKELGVCTSN